MARVTTSDYFEYHNAPEDFRTVAHEGSTAAFRKWCKNNRERLEDALEWLPESEQKLREIVHFELVDYRTKTMISLNKDIHDRLDELKKPHWTASPNFWLTLISAIAASLGAYFAWLALA